MFASVKHPHLHTKAYVSIVSQLIFVHYGFSEGFTGVLIHQLQAPESAMRVSDEELSWIASLLILAMPPGSLLIGVFMEVYGRKTALQLAFLLLIASWTTMALANTILGICLGRVLTGIATGLESAAVVYIAETQTPTGRVFMMAFLAPATLIGALLSYMIGFLLPWNRVALIFVASSVASFVALFGIPESPVWLMKRGNPVAALASLKRLRNSDDQENTHAEFAALQAQIAEPKSSAEGENVSYLRKIIRTKAWKPFLILELFFILQELSGCGLMGYYSTHIYRQLGTPIDELLSTMGCAGAALLSSIIFLTIVNRVDRKTLCFWSAVGVCLSYSAVAAYLFWFTQVQLGFLKWIPVVGTWTAMAFAFAGIHTLTWQMPAELLPTEVRGFLNGLLFTSVYGLIFAVLKLYPTILSVVTVRGLFMVMATAAAADALFAKFVLPETRGKTLAEIEQIW